MKSKKSSKKKTIIISVVCMLIIALITAFALSPRAESYDEETARSQDVTTYYNFNGNIEAKDNQIVIADTMMQIKTIYVEEGDTVKKDDILFETTQGQKIKAKIDGEVGEILIEEGAALMTGTKMTTLTDYSNLQVTVKVDEYDIASMAQDKEVTVLVNALNKEITGKIAKVSKEAITVNGVSYFTASIDLENDPDLLVGMSTEVTMISQSAPNATTISMKALQFDNENQPFVYYKDNSDKVAAKAVTVGINDGNIVQIEDGVKSGEVVLLPKEKINKIATPLDVMGEQ